MKTWLCNRGRGRYKREKVLTLSVRQWEKWALKFRKSCVRLSSCGPLRQIASPSMSRRLRTSRAGVQGWFWVKKNEHTDTLALPLCLQFNLYRLASVIKWGSLIILFIWKLAKTKRTKLMRISKRGRMKNKTKHWQTIFKKNGHWTSQNYTDALEMKFKRSTRGCSIKQFMNLLLHTEVHTKCDKV